MSHTKQRVTLVALVIAACAVLVSPFFGLEEFIAASVLVALAILVYRTVMRHVRRCEHCNSWNVERQHYRERVHPLKESYVCTTYRTCHNPDCPHCGREELEKSYTKEFGLVHFRILKYLGML